MPGASCFGKLPIFADFIRHHAHVPELQTLDQWFQEGITHARQAVNRSWDDEFSGGPPAKFLFVSAVTGRLTVGTWVPGVDKAGRRYPFLIFSNPDVAAFGREAVLAPLIFSDFLQAAGEMAAAGWKGSDLKGFLAKIDTVPVKGSLDGARRKIAEYYAGTSAGDFWKALFGAFEDPRKYVLVQNLVNILGPMRGGQNRIPLALRFPMAPGIEAATWLDLTLRWANRQALPPMFVWSEKAAVILFNELNAKYYAPIMRPDRKTDSICEISVDGQDTAGYLDKAKQRFAPVLEDPTLPVREMLRRLTGKEM